MDRTVTTSFSHNAYPPTGTEMLSTPTVVPAEVVADAKSCFATRRPGAVQATVCVDDDIVDLIDVGAERRERLILAEADGFVVMMSVHAGGGNVSIRGTYRTCVPVQLVVQTVAGLIEVDGGGGKFTVGGVPQGPIRVVASPSTGGADIVTEWMLV